MTIQKESDQIEQPIAVELMLTQDRCAVALLFGSDQPIGLSALIPAIKLFLDELERKHDSQKTVIAVKKKKKIIVP